MDNYKDQHKLKPSGFAKIEQGTSQRVKNQAIRTKSRRSDNFDSSRNIEDDGALSSVCPMISRSEQLKKWKEKQAVKRQEALQNKVKPFTVGVVRHDLLLYKPVSPLKTSKNIEKPNLRSTRSSFKMLSTRNTLERNTVTDKTDQKQPSFAPSNAKFKVPKNIKSDSYTFGSKKVGAVTRSKDMFTDPKPSTSGTQSKQAQPEWFNVFMERLPSTEDPCSSGERITSKPEMKERPESNQDNKLNTSIKLGAVTRSKDMFTDPKPSTSGIQSKQAQPEMSSLMVKRTKPIDCLSQGYVSENRPDKDAAIRFRSVLDSEMTRLIDLCGHWFEYKDDNDAALPESAKKEIHGEPDDTKFMGIVHPRPPKLFFFTMDHIFQAIGQTNLLISKKFEQFRTLIDRCESQQFVEGDGAVVAQDLEGFWDMVFLQVEDIDLRFKRLTKERDNGWVDEKDELKIMQSKSVNLSKIKAFFRNVAPSKGLRAFKASRMKNSKVSSGTEHPQLELSLSKSNIKIFEGGFFSVTTPMKTTIDKPDRGVRKRCISPSRPPSFLKEVPSSEARKGLSLQKSTPSSLAMMRVSQTAKRAMSTDSQLTQDSMLLASINLNAKPAKGIMKSPSKRPQRTTSHEDTAPAEDSKQRNRYRNYITIQNKENPEREELPENLSRATRKEQNTPVDETVDTMQSLERDSAKKNPNKKGTTKNNVSPLARNYNILPEISDLSLNTPRSSKEQKTRSLRSSMVGSEHPICDKSPNTRDVSENRPAIGFRVLYLSEINRLNDLCDQWSKYKEDNDAALPESAKKEIHGEPDDTKFMGIVHPRPPKLFFFTMDHIFQAIGQTNLLISKKFEQFRTLIDRCESQQFVEGDGAVVAQDLEGFWDMVFLQVEDIDLRFKRLTKERDNGWVDEKDELKIMQSKSVNLSKIKAFFRNVAPSKGLRAFKASRMKNSKVSSGTEHPQLELSLSKSNTKIFEGGFFSVTTPMKTTIDKPDRGVRKRCISPSRPPSFLKEVPSSEARKGLSLQKSTPSSLAMMRVSQTAKRAMSTDSQLTQDSMLKDPEREELPKNLSRATRKEQNTPVDETVDTMQPLERDC